MQLNINKIAFDHNLFLYAKSVPTRDAQTIHMPNMIKDTESDFYATKQR